MLTNCTKHVQMSKRSLSTATTTHHGKKTLSGSRYRYLSQVSQRRMRRGQSNGCVESHFNMSLHSEHRPGEASGPICRSFQPHYYSANQMQLSHRDITASFCIHWVPKVFHRGDKRELAGRQEHACPFRTAQGKHCGWDLTVSWNRNATSQTQQHQLFGIHFFTYIPSFPARRHRIAASVFCCWPVPRSGG